MANSFRGQNPPVNAYTINSGGIDPSLRTRRSNFLNYEAQQALLAYMALSLPERILANLPLPFRVLLLRIVAVLSGVSCCSSGRSNLPDISAFRALTSKSLF